MNFNKKYLKYKKKYMILKQLGGSYYFAVYTFTNSLLDEDTKTKMITLLSSLYGPKININIETKQPPEDQNWVQAVEFIQNKSCRYIFPFTTAFIIHNVSIELNSMDDDILTRLELQIKGKFEEYNIDKLDFPILDEDNENARGWGLQGDNVAIITFVEK